MMEYTLFIIDEVLYLRGLFKKYRTFGRQKYNYLFRCLKP